MTLKAALLFIYELFGSNSSYQGKGSNNEKPKISLSDRLKIEEPAILNFGSQSIEGVLAKAPGWQLGKFKVVFGYSDGKGDYYTPLYEKGIKKVDNDSGTIKIELNDFKIQSEQIYPDHPYGEYLQNLIKTHAPNSLNYY